MKWTNIKMHADLSSRLRRTMDKQSLSGIAFRSVGVEDHRMVENLHRRIERILHWNDLYIKVRLKIR